MKRRTLPEALIEGRRQEFFEAARALIRAIDEHPLPVINQQFVDQKSRPRVLQKQTRQASRHEVQRQLLRRSQTQHKPSGTQDGAPLLRSSI